MSAFTEANRSAFDDLANTYNTKPWQKALAEQVKEALQARKEWIGAEWLKPDEEDREVKLLDFASGTGNISNALSPYVTTVRGIDISPNMVQAYNTAAQSSGAYAIEGDLFAAEGTPAHLSTPEFSNFDIAVVGLGFHHFEDPKLALSRLAERLKPITGVLVILDFLPFQKAFPKAEDGRDMNPTIKHHGFTPEELRDQFTAAGFVDFDIVALKKPAMMEGKDGVKVERTMFMAKGRKAGSVLQRLGAWVGGMQDAVGGQMAVDKNAKTGWNPGAAGGQREEGAWNVVGKAQGKPGEEWSGYESQDKGEKKSWNGF